MHIIGKAVKIWKQTSIGILKTIQNQLVFPDGPHVKQIFGDLGPTGTMVLAVFVGPRFFSFFVA